MFVCFWLLALVWRYVQHVIECSPPVVCTAYTRSWNFPLTDVDLPKSSSEWVTLMTVSIWFEGSETEHPIGWIIRWDTVTEVRVREKRKSVYTTSVHQSKLNNVPERKEQRFQLIRSTACSNVGIARAYKRHSVPELSLREVFPSDIRTPNENHLK